jgi:8-oxo-dGTP diphosphatase
MSQPSTVRRPDAHVVAAALFDAEGRLLLAERPPGKHMAGGWEFPGGKREPGEERFDTLKRELKEEIGIEIHEAEPLVMYEHHYPDRKVTLDLWFVTRYSGTPQSLEGQNLKWVALTDLDQVGLLEADAPMVAPLKARAAKLPGA